MKTDKKSGFFVVTGGIIAVMAGAMYLKSNHLQKNYHPVEAVITKTEIDCYVKIRKNNSDSSTNTAVSYFDCDHRPRALGKFIVRDIKQRVTATYRYTSPVDGNQYTGSFIREGRRKAEELPIGKTIPVFASKTEPAVSTTSDNNVFIDSKHKI